MPMVPAPNRAESDAAFPLVMEQVRRLAEGGFQALLLAGSHASGEAVWAEDQGRRRCLSDLDLYLVLDSAGARTRAMSRFASAHTAIDDAGHREGLGHPVEVSFLDGQGLAELPARPGTVELKRQGRVLDGDAGCLARLPDWTARDIPREERLLLLENRAFELLLAHDALARDGALARLEARHAVHKTALDLAMVSAIERGEFPLGARARVEWARRNPPQPSAAWPGGPNGFGPELEKVWDEALAWRTPGAAPRIGVEDAWPAVARAWCALWLAIGRWRDVPGAGGSNGRTEPYAFAHVAARRSPLRRRLRLAWFPESARAAPAPERLRHLLAGTPQHRVNAAAAILLLTAIRPGADPGRPTIDPRAGEALGTLGFPASGGWIEVARTVTRAWDRWVLEGRRVTAW